MLFLAVAFAVLALCSVEDKGFAVGALTCCGVTLVSTHCDLVKGTEIAGVSVVCALSYSAGDSMIGLLDFFHFKHHPFCDRDLFDPEFIMPQNRFFIRAKQKSGIPKYTADFFNW